MDLQKTSPDGCSWGSHAISNEGWTVRPEGKISNVLTAWDDSGFRCKVFFPGIDSDRAPWALDEITDPYTLYNAVEIFENLTGVHPEHWQKNFREMLKNSWGKNWPRVLSEKPQEYFKPFIEKMESEFISLRVPNAAEKELAYCHAFDKRMMFLSAARGGYFGTGEYEEVQNIKLSDIEKGVGLVQVEPIKFSDALLPEFPAFLAELFSGQDMFYTPYLQAFDKYIQGSVKIKKGWVWKSPVRIFEKYAKTLGDAIKVTRADGLAEKAVNQSLKFLYTRPFGWLGRGCDCELCYPEAPDSPFCKIRGRNDFFLDLFRPDWRGLIVADAGTNLLRNVENVYTCTRKLPFAINHDCLMYFSENKDWRVDFDKTAVSDPNKYTHEWTLPAKVVLDAIADGKNAAQIDGIGKAEVENA